MKYAGKYYPFSFVRAASSPHPRTHTDARHSWCMPVSVTPEAEVTHHAWHGLCRAAEAAATASNPWPLRADSHAPSSAGGVRWRDSWTCGGRRALARRDTGQTLSDIGRERAAGRAPASYRSVHATCSIAKRYFEIIVNTVQNNFNFKI